MKFTRHMASLVLASVMLLGMTACTPQPEGSADKSIARIFLYGEEEHGAARVCEKELDIWREHYQNDGMRHLFMELPYYTAEFLNVWMKSDSDDILDALYDDTEGTMGHTSAVKELYQSIKRECPETIFHGTDVGHQYDTTGKRFLEYLDSQGQENSKTYALTEEAIKQGEYYYKDYDEPYRENTMAQNFMHEYDALGGESVAGFFGAAHTKPEALDFYGNVPCMANQLKQQYGDVIYSENLQP